MRKEILLQRRKDKYFLIFLRTALENISKEKSVNQSWNKSLNKRQESD